MMKARPRSRSRLRQLVLVFGACLVIYCLFFVLRSPGRPKLTPEILNSLSLTEQECLDAFPGLTKSIDDVVAEGPFKIKNTGDLGPLQGRIRDGKIYIINAQRRKDLSAEMLNSRTAALHQLHRAILTAPEPLPDTIFTINFQDQPFGTAWGYSTPADPAHRGDRARDPDKRLFLMPHFSFWAWPLPFVGSVARAARAIAAVEDSHRHDRHDGGSLASKDPRAVWRGTSWFNSVHSPRLRQDLLAAARDKPWADVQPLKWDASPASAGGSHNASNAIPIEDFCRHRYVLHTEGVAYSGRFQFLQMCRSVTLTPAIHWLQHTTHLVRPVFAAEIPGLIRDPAVAEKARAARERSRRAWPVGYDPAREANIVFVAPDWSDLEDAVAWLEANPRVAEGIAARQRETFVGGGYFSPAAEACYWRALVRGWHSVARWDEAEWEGKEEVTFEAFALTQEMPSDRER